jgi:hypothetical protein
MAQAPTSKQVPINNAAKDDALGADGVYTFKIADLLANDPGGAAKLDLTKQFFFGSTAADQADQAGYMKAHGIVDNHDGTFTLNSSAIDFDYFVQIGNKGTWSEAHVDVTAPPAPTGHAGNALFIENFDSYTAGADHGSWQQSAITTPTDGPAAGHYWANKAADGSWVGVTDGELLKAPELVTSGNQSLDTQNSPGRVDMFNWFVDPTGGKAQLTFDIAKQNWGSASTTDSNAAFQFKVDGNVVAEVHAGDLVEANHMYSYHVEFDVAGGPGAGHQIELVDVTPGANDHITGFAVDSIHINDWIV